jgi:hypothetical protein
MRRELRFHTSHCIAFCCLLILLPLSALASSQQNPDPLTALLKQFEDRTALDKFNKASIEKSTKTDQFNNSPPKASQKDLDAAEVKFNEAEKAHQASIKIRVELTKKIVQSAEQCGDSDLTKIFTSLMKVVADKDLDTYKPKKNDLNYSRPKNDDTEVRRAGLEALREIWKNYLGRQPKPADDLVASQADEQLAQLAVLLDYTAISEDELLSATVDLVRVIYAKTSGKKKVDPRIEVVAAPTKPTKPSAPPAKRAEKPAQVLVTDYVVELLEKRNKEVASNRQSDWQRQVLELKLGLVRIQVLWFKLTDSQKQAVIDGLVGLIGDKDRQMTVRQIAAQELVELSNATKNENKVAAEMVHAVLPLLTIVAPLEPQQQRNIEWQVTEMILSAVQPVGNFIQLMFVIF